LVRFKISGRPLNPFPNGIIYLKGGDVEKELEDLRAEYAVYPLSEFFGESFFDTKKVVHIYNFSNS
jgi:16S rRNA (guanine527-N7)-methyltransferase